MKSFQRVLYFMFGLCMILQSLSCKKYPEDEHISLKSPGKRILGSWKITRYEVNGIDSTDHFLNKYGYSHVVFKKEKGRYNTFMYGKECDNCDEFFIASWSLGSKKLFGNETLRTYIGYEFRSYLIRKLTSDECILLAEYPLFKIQIVLRKN